MYVNAHAYLYAFVRVRWKQVSPFLIPALISNTASGVVAIEHKARGPNFGVVSACATGTHAIGTAMDFMLRGEVRRSRRGALRLAGSLLCLYDTTVCSGN